MMKTIYYWDGTYKIITRLKNNTCEWLAKENENIWVKRNLIKHPINWKDEPISKSEALSIIKGWEGK